MERKKENLVSIDEIIRRAKKLGVNFGKGNPRNRLRYYTKIGLLPHAQRASFNGRPPTGAYPEYVISILLSIDKKLKEGKSILQIKRELEKEKKEELPFRFETEKLSEISPFEISKREIKVAKKRKINFQKIFKKSILWVLFSVSLISFLFVFANNGKNFLSSAIFSFLQGRIAQVTPAETEKTKNETFVFPYVEPYLTINADTGINGSLSIKDNLSFQREGYKAMFDFETLTSDRTYTFPNASGIVCLTSGNCFGIFGEVKTAGGTPNRIAKFIGASEIGDSSISDLYAGGISIAISDTGNVGIGTENPRYKLHVIGRIQATDDICTDLAGGKCLSELVRAFYGVGIARGIAGSGTPGTLALWTSPTALGSSLIYQSGGNIGIGVSSPTQKLDVGGFIKVLGFQLATTTQAGWVLTSDGNGFGTWQPAPVGTLPSGTTGQTLRHDGTNWIANSFLYNTGSAIGIGTTSTLATLTVSGDSVFLGELQIESMTFPQLVLKYDDNNYLRFSISSTSTKIFSSNDLYINSLTGEVFSNATITAHSFRADDATVRAPQEYVFRQSIPIFKYPYPAETASTSFVTVSNDFTIPLDTVPQKLPGTTRKYGFLINEADTIPTDASSTWQISSPSTSTTFYLSGQNNSSLDKGKPRLIGFIELPDETWQLKVALPSTDKRIRIFNIFLLVYDQLP